MLIDDERLPSLVIQYRMGVQAERASKTVAADESFFEYFRGAGEAPSGYSVAQQRERDNRHAISASVSEFAGRNNQRIHDVMRHLLPQPLEMPHVLIPDIWRQLDFDSEDLPLVAFHDEVDFFATVMSSEVPHSRAFGLCYSSHGEGSQGLEKASRHVRMPRGGKVVR